MKILRCIVMSLSLFSKVPMPKLDWREENLRYTLVALPIVGIAIGLALWGWMWVCDRLALPDMLFAGGVTLLPLLLTGGIHMDGFCDTVDALNSHASPERKLAILKDPHPGAFAVMFTCAYFLGYFALANALPRESGTVWLLTLLHMGSRAAGAFAALAFPLAGEGGMLASCRKGTATRPAVTAVCALFVLIGAGTAAVSPLPGAVMTAVAALCTAYVRWMSRKEFGGMRGDLVGYLIALSELWMLLGLVLTERWMLL